MRLVSSRPLVLALGSALACTPAPNYGGVETEGRAACDNLDETHCAFPFPSNRFLATVDGHPVVSFEDDSLPVTTAEVPINPAAWREKDGFSPITPIFFGLPGATLAGAPTASDIGASLQPSSPTQIIDAETGARVGHFAEWDYFFEDKGARIVALRLANKLAYGRRYVVAVTGLKDADGAPVPAPRGFAALRDRKASVVLGVDARRERFEKDIFPVLATAGLERSTVQLAWDFTTSTETNCNGLMLEMREKLFAAIGADGPEYTITAVEQPNDENIATIVRGLAKVPSFLDGVAGDIQRIRRDAAGAPALQGFESVEFVLQIPKSALAATEALPILQYGHGLLGSKSEANNGWLRELANREGFLILAIDMQGMSNPDSLIWSGVLGGDVSAIPHLAEKIHQGVLNHLAVTRLFAGRFLRDTDPRYTRAGGGPLYDPSRFWYYGNSQGGTMGGVMMPLQTEVKRGILGVPGGAFAYLLTRAAQFAELAPLITGNYPDPAGFAVIMGLTQLGFDKVDPLNYSHRLSSAPFPGTPSHSVLLHLAMEDAQVHNQVTDVVARNIGAKLLLPVTRPVWGLETVETSHTGNVLASYDFNKPSTSATNRPASEADDTHELLRRLRRGQDQVMHFLRTGEVKQLCEGPCDPD
jgi:hypothetical protein